MNLADHLDEINALTDVLRSPALVKHLQGKVAEHTEMLISNDNEQARGRIKALRALLTLPDELQYERDGITAELTAQAASA